MAAADADAAARLVARRVMVGLFDGDLPNRAEIDRIAAVDTASPEHRVAAVGAPASRTSPPGRMR